MDQQQSSGSELKINLQKNALSAMIIMDTKLKYVIDNKI